MPRDVLCFLLPLTFKRCCKVGRLTDQDESFDLSRFASRAAASIKMLQLDY